MSKISANCLFHFTNKIEHLEDILENDFSPRFSLETIHGSSTYNYDDVEIAIPMVCFCDIPLSQIKLHMGTYGKYAIGLNKEWGISNKISPVMYYYKNSKNYDSFLKLFDYLLAAQTSKEINPVDEILKFGVYAKPYEGLFFRNGKYSDKTIRFYDEREWRYVPDIKQVKDCDVVFNFTKENYFNPSFVVECNEKLKKTRLKFTPKDVKYIIVEDESQILELVNRIGKIKGKYSHEEVLMLTTRIITSTQIEEDF